MFQISVGNVLLRRVSAKGTVYWCCLETLSCDYMVFQPPAACPSRVMGSCTHFLLPPVLAEWLDGEPVFFTLIEEFLEITIPAASMLIIRMPLILEMGKESSVSLKYFSSTCTSSLFSFFVTNEFNNVSLGCRT